MFKKIKGQITRKKKKTNNSEEKKETNKNKKETNEKTEKNYNVWAVKPKKLNSTVV